MGQESLGSRDNKPKFSKPENPERRGFLKGVAATLTLMAAGAGTILGRRKILEEADKDKALIERLRNPKTPEDFLFIINEYLDPMKIFLENNNIPAIALNQSVYSGKNKTLKEKKEKNTLNFFDRGLIAGIKDLNELELIRDRISTVVAYSRLEGASLIRNTGNITAEYLDKLINEMTKEGNSVGLVDSNNSMESKL